MKLWNALVLVSNHGIHQTQWLYFKMGMLYQEYLSSSERQGLGLFANESGFFAPNNSIINLFPIFESFSVAYKFA